MNLKSTIATRQKFTLDTNSFKIHIYLFKYKIAPAKDINSLQNSAIIIEGRFHTKDIRHFWLLASSQVHIPTKCCKLLPNPTK